MIRPLSIIVSTQCLSCIIRIIHNSHLNSLSLQVSHRLLTPLGEVPGVSNLNGLRELYQAEACERHPVVLLFSNTTHTNLDRVGFSEFELYRSITPATAIQTTTITNGSNLDGILTSEELEVNIGRSAATGGQLILTCGQANLLNQGNIPCLGAPVTTIEVLVSRVTLAVGQRLSVEYTQ